MRVIVKAIFVFFCIVLTGFFNSTVGLAQDRYIHFSGETGNSIHVTANLIFTDTKVFGTILRPSMDEIPVKVYGELQQDRNLVLLEEYSADTIIRGNNSEEFSFNGFWKDNNANHHPLILHASKPEKYQQFKVFSQSSVRPLNDSPDSPVAAFDMVLAMPASEDNMEVHFRLNKTIGELLKIETSGNISYAIKNQENLFFERYQAANASRSTPENYPLLNWQKRVRLFPVFNENGFVSLYMQDYNYTGGDVSLDISRFLVFDLQKAEKITLSSLIPEEKSTALSEKLRKKLCKNLELSNEISLKEQGFFSDEVFPSANFFLTASGIGFHYNTYELAGQERGSLTIFLTWKEMEGILNTDGPVKRLNTDI